MAEDLKIDGFEKTGHYSNTLIRIAAAWGKIRSDAIL